MSCLGKGQETYFIAAHLMTDVLDIWFQLAGYLVIFCYPIPPKCYTTPDSAMDILLAVSDSGWI